MMGNLSTRTGTADEVYFAYDYRAFGVNYFGARYLDPMLGLWISVDPAGQFASPYLYAGNGVNPINGVDDDGNVLLFAPGSSPEFKAEFARAIQYLNNGKSSSIIAQLHGGNSKIVDHSDER